MDARNRRIRRCDCFDVAAVESDSTAVKRSPFNSHCRRASAKILRRSGIPKVIACGPPTQVQLTMTDPNTPDDGASNPATVYRSDPRAFHASLQRGDSQAIERFFNEYSRKLVKLASNHIHPALRKRFDGEDVVQSVFRTFFRRHEQGKFEIAHSEQLWQLLVTLTLCKTRSHARKHTADRRDARVERSPAEDRLVDQEPSSADALALQEEIDLVLSGLPDRAGEMLAMRLAGTSKTEIAGELNVSRQTVHRVLKLLEERLTKRFDQISAISSQPSENSGN